MKHYKLFGPPDGMKDYLPDEKRQMDKSEQILERLFTGAGYELVKTPELEFYDLYQAGGGLVAEEDLIKTTDSNGRLLTLRYDGTVPVARLAGQTGRGRQGPLRFSYIDSMYRFREQGGGRLRGFRQAGIELLGVSQAAGDAEVIALAIAAARALGLGDLQVSIGQAGFYRSLTADWTLDERQRTELARLIDRRNGSGARALLKEEELSESDEAILERIVTRPDDWAVLQELLAFQLPEGARDALLNLIDIMTLLEGWGYLDVCSPDLALQSSMGYYTGSYFKGYTYGIGFPVFSGGRYDTVCGLFGEERPATGFSMGLDLVQEALARQGLLTDSRPGLELLFIPEDEQSGAMEARRSLVGSAGKAIELVWLPDLEAGEAAVYRDRVAAERQASALWLLTKEGVIAWD